MGKTKALIAVALALALGLTTVAAAANYYYDELGRLQSVDYDDGEASITYSYDANDNRTEVVAINAAGDPPVNAGGVIVVPLNGFTVIPLP